MLIAAGCGAADDGAPTPAGSRAVPTTFDGDHPALARVRAGVIAAGGDFRRWGDAGPCTADNTLIVGYVGPDVSKLDEIGLGSLVIEEPRLVIDAYLDAVNHEGGIGGQCFAAAVHVWDPADPAGSADRICAELADQAPLFTFNFLGDLATITCLTLERRIPMLGLHASAPSEVLPVAAGRLFLDDGARAYLLENSIEVALRTQHLDPDAQLGLLRHADVSFPAWLEASIALQPSEADWLEAVIERYGFAGGLTSTIPEDFGELRALMAEQRAGVLRADLSEPEQAAADAHRAGLSPSAADLMNRIEDFYLSSASTFRDAGVQVVVSTAPWYEMRRLMRAAESVDWHPWWIASDVQGATLTLTDAPSAQARRFVLVSARRSAGDAVPELDRGCSVLRNSSRAAPPFAHRHHTDAWSVLAATCDALDVAVAALSKVPGELTPESFVEAMRETSYDAAFGGRISYGSDDSSGADRFRVLEADPDCVLDDWGCMRALTDWLAPVAYAEDASAAR